MNNFIASFREVTKDTDDILKEAKLQYGGERHALWGYVLFVRTFFKIRDLKSLSDDVHWLIRLCSNIYAVYGALIFGFGSAWMTFIQQYSQYYYLFLLLPILIVTLNIRSNLLQMLSLKSKYFHLGAYRRFRKIEYRMILPYLKVQNFSYNHLYDRFLLLQDGKTADAIKQYVSVHENSMKKLQEQLGLLNQQLAACDRNRQDAEKDLEETYRLMDQLVQQVRVNEFGYNYAIDQLFRLRLAEKGLFKRDDLRIISSYSLFRLYKNTLVRIDQLGTTETPHIINLNNPQFFHYSSVMLLRNDTHLEFSKSIREGRMVGSYRIHLSDNETLIYNFHFNSEDTHIYDIIRTKEMYRLIRVICIHLHERGLLEEEGENFGAS